MAKASKFRKISVDNLELDLCNPRLPKSKHNRTASVFLIIVIAILLNSCKYECPCFDKSLLTWIPQEYGDEIKFSNQFNDTIVFIVNRKEYTDSYKIERQNKKSCDSKAELDAYNNNYGFYINLSKPLYSDFYIYGGIALNEELSGGFNIETSNVNELTENLILNGKNYNSIKFETDTITSDAGIYKIILAENYGLLQFYEKSGAIWTFIEE